MIRPPDLPVAHDHVLKIAGIERAAGSEAHLRLPPDDARALRETAIAESVAALLRMEGAPADRARVDRTPENPAAAAIVGDDPLAPDIAGMRGALRMALAQIARFEPEEENLRRIHESSFAGSARIRRPGEYRADGFALNAYGRDGRLVDQIFRAPPLGAGGRTPGALLAGLRAELDEHRLHPLEAISWAMAELLAIQPFGRGSIPTVHIYVRLLMERWGYWFGSIRSLDAIMEAEGGYYFVALRKVRRSLHGDRSGLAAWHSFFFGCVARQAARAREALGSILDAPASPALAPSMPEFRPEPPPPPPPPAEPKSFTVAPAI